VSVLLVRVDDRLVHGQVTQGWGNLLHPDRIVVVNDEVAASSWERELYEASAPEGITVSVVALGEAPTALDGWLKEEEELFVLLASPADALRLYREGFEFDVLNVGGLHHRAGCRRILPYLCLAEEDEGAFRALAREGVGLECSDVPGSERKDLLEWLGNGINGI
jgi:mannose/fructose/N-acetylgalactosamine-specific phosphotransferase system component IIB